MGVYIDNVNIRYRGMIMNHMIADTSTELIDMIERINVNKKHLQYTGTPKEHIDICLSKKKLAIRLGAKEIGFRELAIKIKHRREQHS